MFLRRFFFIRLSGLRCGSDLYLCFTFYSKVQLFLVSGYFGVEDSSFLTKGIFCFLKGTKLVPVEIELVPEFGSLPSPRLPSPSGVD